MTRGELKVKINSNLSDLGITFFTSTDIDDAVTDAYNFISVYAKTVESSTILQFAANNPYYLVVPGIPNCYAVTAIYDLTRKRFLTYKSRLDLMSMRRNYELWPGVPEWFFVHSFARIGICPQPTVAGFYKVFFRAFESNATADNHTGRLPAAADDCLEFYACADLLEQAQEWSTAQIFWDKFYSHLRQTKLVIGTRPMPALMTTLAEVSL